MSLYLWINLLSLAGPFLLSFDKKVHFYTHWKTLFPAILVVGSLFIAWDVFFTDIGVWGFNPEYLSGIHFFNLPIEECMFFFTIPYACVFIYECVKAYFPKFRPVQFSYFFSLLFTITCLVLGIIFYDNWYTSVALIGAGLINWIVYFGFTPRWHPFFIVAFLITQVPFLIVNGVLTGVATDAPVVWYNEKEIIGLRVLSIPIEDIFYNFFMLFSVVILHEYLGKLWDQKTKST
ncbi:lycopene cyclase domain-containing protein [Brumimicrobium salinarum]|uniref:Lycopene cyclase domain-containing protein n=1 Tax=Brumimicrobium salinarum TaxID=2058658 RepID=A0A2I0R6Q2_9FLAO|nr:lycopene cyclase domain-containing protein [Brumimicrobium salinarum]PKR82229.1 lycopene cyclase domain-containing protein [Brumimicrobium salinarum]